jgi:membrane protein
MRLKAIGALFKDACNEWLADKASRLGAALAYYTIFSLAPLLFLVIGIAGLVFGQQAVRGDLDQQMKTAFGEPAATAIQDLLKNTQQTGTGPWATAIGLVVLFFGATGLFVQLQDALNTIWKVMPRPGRPIWSMLVDRWLSFLLILGTAFLLLVFLVASTALSAVHHFLPTEALPGGIYVWQVINGVVSFGFAILLFAMVYKILPDVHITWRDVWIGATVTALLFTAGKYLLSLYLSWGSTASAFGAAASLVVVLLWVYYSAQIFLFGAEFTRVYADRYGAQVRPTENAIRVTPEQLAREGTLRNADLEAAARANRGTDTAAPDPLRSQR